MSNADPSVWTNPILGVVAAFLAVAQAVLVIDKRLGRVQEIESQVGQLPKPVRWAYVVPQRSFKNAFIGIAAAATAGFLAFLFPDQIDFGPFVYARDHGRSLLILWFVLGVIAYTNLISWSVVWLGRFLGRLGVSDAVFNDRHPAWYAFQSLVDYNEQAKPLVVDVGNARAFANGLVGMLKDDPTVINRAAAPAQPTGAAVGGFRGSVGNALLAGCVIEEAKYDLHMPDRDWGPFYAAIGKVATETAICSPETLRSQRDWGAYTDLFVVELNQRLVALAQTAVPGTAALKDRLNKSFEALATSFSGDASSIIAGRWWSPGSRLDVAYDRLASLPTLKSASMKAQFVKLAAVWDVWHDVPLSAFRFPFAKRIAAVLLDRAVIRAPEDVKVLAFGSTQETQVVEAAERMVIHEAIRLIELDRQAHQDWLPAASLNTTGEHFRWWAAYELDLRLWDYAKRLHAGMVSGDSLTRWKESDSQVARISSKP